MTIEEKCIIELEIIKSFLESYNVVDWVERTDNAINLISNSNQDLKLILQNYFGQGGGSFHDIWISELNGFKLKKSAKEVNDELSMHAENLLKIKRKLK